MTLLLFLTYTLLLGVMLVLISIFSRRLLWQPRKKDSYWKRPEGYEANLKESQRQS